MTRLRQPLRLGLAGTLGAGAALLVGCGSGGTALIPAGDASKLSGDFDSVAAAVGAGKCRQTVSAIVQSRRDLGALPATVDPRLAAALRSGVDTLSKRAQLECKQQATSTATTPPNTSTAPTTDTSTSSTTTTPTNTSTATTPQTTPTPTTTSTTPQTNPAPAPTTTGTTPSVVPDNGGGTPAPNGQSGKVKQGGDGASGPGGTPGAGGGN